MPVDNKTLIHNSVAEIFNKGDATNAANFFAGELQHTVAQGVKENKAIFPDLQYNINQISAEGDTVAFTYAAKGTQKAALEGLAASGKTAQWTGSALATVADGKIVHIYVQEDQIAKLAALGHLHIAVSMTGKWVGSASGITVSLNLTQSGVNVTGSCTITGFTGTFAVTGSNHYPNVSLTSNLGNGLVAVFNGAFTGANAVHGKLTIMGSSMDVTINRQ
jgi:predicted ester cyclase